MPVLSVSGLSVSFGERTLFSDVGFIVGKKDKVGLIGRNGAGKTTLFRLLTGALSPAAGTVAFERGAVVGYMEQHVCENSDRTIYDELLSVFDGLMEKEREIDELNRKIDLSEGDLSALVERQTRLIEEFERDGGLTYQSRTRSALLGLGFCEDEFLMPVKSLSGGQRSKLSLLKLLLSECSLLLLDEPTNHLDIGSVSWLENFLRDYPGTVILISHDRYFLDAVTNKTLELEHGRSRLFSGSYTTFVKKKEAEQEAIRRKYENDMREIHRIEGIVEQQRRWNREKNIITAESKLKEIDRIKARLVVPDGELETMKMTFSPNSPGGNDVLICRGLKKSFASNHLFSNLDMHIKKGERVFILGENGCGKTTLFRILMGRETADAGDVTFGAGIEKGYFDQLGEDLNLSKTAMSEVWDAFPHLTETSVRSALARFLFKGDEVFKPLSAMSGGERARVSLLKLMLKGGNFLLLDEPTNHLDSSSREELENTLLSYGGTLLVVSHDRYFINKLATRILVMTENGMKEYLGNYDDYIQREKNSPLGETDAAAAYSKTALSGKSDRLAAKESPPSARSEKPKNEWALRKMRESEERKRKTRLQKTENEIECLEHEIEELQALLSSDEVTSDYERLMTLTEQLDALQKELDEQYEHWEALST